MKLRFQLRDLFFAVTLLSVVLAYFAYDLAGELRRQKSAQTLQEVAALYHKVNVDAPPPDPADHLSFERIEISRDNPWLSRRPISTLSESQIAAAVRAFPEVRRLAINRPGESLDPAWSDCILALSRLEDLHITAASVDEQALAAILTCKQLKALSLRTGPLPSGFPRQLADLPALRFLTLDAETSRLDKKDLELLGKLTELDFLVLHGFQGLHDSTTICALGSERPFDHLFEVRPTTIGLDNFDLKRFEEAHPRIHLAYGPLFSVLDSSFLLPKPLTLPPSPPWYDRLRTREAYWLWAMLAVVTLSYALLRIRGRRRNAAQSIQGIPRIAETV